MYKPTKKESRFSLMTLDELISEEVSILSKIAIAKDEFENLIARHKSGEKIDQLLFANSKSKLRRLQTSHQMLLRFVALKKLEKKQNSTDFASVFFATAKEILPPDIYKRITRLTQQKIDKKHNLNV